MRFAAEHRADLYFLNNDLIFTPHWLDPLLLPEPAILAPVSNWRSHPRQGGFVCTPTMDLSDYLGHEADLIEIARRHRLELSGHPRRFSEWFFCVKIPHVVYSKVGFLDERFGRGGGEDCDYCLRAHLAGFGVRLALQSFVLHFMGKSTWRGAETSEQQRNRESHYRHAFIRKWGQDLFDLMLGGGQAPLQRNPAALASFNAGDYRSVVRQLMPPDAIPDALVLA
jgi:GT2 family glycosyltransferase